MTSRWIYAAGLAVAALLAFFLYRHYRVAPEIDPAALHLFREDGVEISLAEFTGKKLIVCFGASWCGPCRQELDDLSAVAANLEGAEVIVITDESSAKTRDFRESGSYPFVFLTMDKHFSDIGIRSIPTTYLVDRNGKVREKVVGRIDWRDRPARQSYLRLLE